MKSARIDNKLVFAANYTPKADDTFCCADFNCAARMKFMPETIESGFFIRPAHFASLSRKEHRKGCTALQAQSLVERESINLSEALSKNRTIIFSLNDRFGLPEPLWNGISSSYTSPYRPQTDLDRFKKSLRNNKTGEKGHHSVPIKSIRDLFNTLAKIETQVGVAEFENIQITWQDMRMPYFDFYLDSKEQQKALFYEILDNSKSTFRRGEKVNPLNKADYGFPRLIKFIPSLNTRDNSALGSLLSSPIQKRQNENDGQMILQNKIRYEPRHLNRGMFAQDCFILAVPYAPYVGLETRMDEYTKGARKTTFISLDWLISGTHQALPAKGLTPPKPNNSRQLQLI